MTDIQTYNPIAALILYDAGYHICIAHPDGEEVPVGREEIKHNEGHLFVSTKSSKDNHTCVSCGSPAHSEWCEFCLNEE